MDIQTIHKFEKAIILLMNNFQGWELTWSGGGMIVTGKHPQGK